MPGTLVDVDDVRSTLHLAEALDLTRTGDLWLFRGPSLADRAIRVVTNAPVNHVGMAVVIEDLPPLMWHAELGQGLTDVWSGDKHRGVQLHDLEAAVRQWVYRYKQVPWLRQLDAEVTPRMEDELLAEIARADGLSFPRTASLAGRWVRGRFRRDAPIGVSYCAEVVARAYQVMGLLDDGLPANAYDPGTFWSGDAMQLTGDARLGTEIEVRMPADPGDSL